MQEAVCDDLVVQGQIFHRIYKIRKIGKLSINEKRGFVLRD